MQEDGPNARPSFEASSPTGITVATSMLCPSMLPLQNACSIAAAAARSPAVRALKAGLSSACSDTVSSLENRDVLYARLLHTSCKAGAARQARAEACVAAQARTWRAGSAPPSRSGRLASINAS